MPPQWGDLVNRMGTLAEEMFFTAFAHSDCEGCNHSACPVKKVAKGRKVQTPPHDENPSLKLTAPTAKPAADLNRQVIAQAALAQKKPASW